jgi:signal transduction histidine kinase
MSPVIKEIKDEKKRIAVLLVEDQSMIIEGVRRLLATDPTVAFHYVSDPNQALASIIRIGPTVVLQDLVMPGVNGLDLVRAYRNNPAISTVPVIVLSSKEDPATKQAAFESGANDYMVKMPHRIELLARVHLHSEAYFNELQRERAFQAAEANQRILTEKNRELALVNQKLEAANRFKSEFFANVSHELRTPLIAVLGMVEILNDTSLSVHQRELVDVIRASGETLLPIINDILDLSKLESDRLELEPAPFLLRDVVDQILDLLAPIAFGKRLEISAWIDRRLPSTVIGDISRVRQVLLNALNNAIKYTSAGEIYLEVKPSGDSGNMIHFCLEDTGIGISEEMLSQLYRSFSQVDASPNRRFSGLGLGLSICHKLSALMGGRMWLESTVGKGTQLHFVISLPASNIAERAHNRVDLSSKRMDALVRNARLIRMLAAWTTELALKFLVRSDQPVNLEIAQPDYLIIDADRCAIEIPQTGQVTVLLLTRSKNISELANRYPATIVLSLPLKKHRFLQAIGILPEAANGGRAPENISKDPKFARLNILVVDDINVNRRVCVAQLQKLGVQKISEAENGRKAIAAAQSQAFDLILMDVQMPEIDGLQATQRIRVLLPSTRQPRIIGLTANALSEQRETCLGAGMDDKLTKPLRIDELKAVLEAIAGGDQDLTYASS